MKKADVIDLLKTNQKDEPSLKSNPQPSKTSHLENYGIGLTVLRTLAKQIGCDHSLAKELWESDIYEARVLALLVDDPKCITREQVESQVEELDHGYLPHVFSSCDATLAKAPFVVELAGEWINSRDPMRRRCGYGLLYEVSKSRKKNAPDDDFFSNWIAHIRATFQNEDRSVNHAMGVALMGMGSRNRTLHATALSVARQIGPLEIGTDEAASKTFDVVERLTHPVVLKKIGLEYPQLVTG